MVTAMPTTVYQPFMVGIDEPMFPALADPTDRWNGYLGSPWFTRHTACAVANWANATGCVQITVDDEGVWLRDLQWDDEPDDPRGELNEWNSDIDGNPRAVIGGWEWCWKQWEADNIPTADEECDWTPVTTDGPLGHGWECTVCGNYQAG